MKVYEMEMEFEVVIGLKEINNLMSSFGFNEKACARGNFISIKQTVPFVPDNDYLEKVSNVIKEGYNNDKLEILECRFVGYKKFLEKEVDA